MDSINVLILPDRKFTIAIIYDVRIFVGAAAKIVFDDPPLSRANCRWLSAGRCGTPYCRKESENHLLVLLGKLSHFPFSPDLVLSYFHWFVPHKDFLWGTKFCWERLSHFPFRGCPRGVMVKAIYCGIIVSEFVLQSRYYIHFRANTHGKGMNTLIPPPAMG